MLHLGTPRCEMQGEKMQAINSTRKGGLCELRRRPAWRRVERRNAVLLPRAPSVTCVCAPLFALVDRTGVEQED